MFVREHKDAVRANSAAVATALLLCGEAVTPNDRNLRRVLDFFAIPWKAMKPSDGDVQEHPKEYSIVSLVDDIARPILYRKDTGETLPPWIKAAKTVYIYGFTNNDVSSKLLWFLTQDTHATICPIRSRETTMRITVDSPEMCGPLSGMDIPVVLGADEFVCDYQPGNAASRSIVRADNRDVFLEVVREGVRFYLNMSAGTLDIDALSPVSFDVKKYFCEVVPLILYLRSAFPNAAFRPSETNACLIVDDPPLKRRYGFLDFAEALELMDRHNFTTAIAFIPWNWRRSDCRTLRLFQSRPDRLSLVVHGCDHTAGELAVRSAPLLDHILRTARGRMESFRRTTSVEAAAVMVFPQGRFSPEVGRALKLNGFTAAVNTEVAPSTPELNETTIADLWSIANTRYGTFPIFTRRYLHHGIENFAFDALLGKPCLIAAHHDIFRDHGRILVDFVTRLNSLNWNLVWRPLGQALARSFATRGVDDETKAIQMFASSIVVENSDAESCKVLILKKEVDHDCVQAVEVDELPVDFSFGDGYLRVRFTIPPAEKILVRIVYRNHLEVIREQYSSGTKMSVSAKRYLSEFRDNYLSRNDLLYKSAHLIKHLLT